MLICPIPDTNVNKPKTAYSWADLYKCSFLEYLEGRADKLELLDDVDRLVELHHRARRRDAEPGL